MTTTKERLLKLEKAVGEIKYFLLCLDHMNPDLLALGQQELPIPVPTDEKKNDD